MTSAESLFFLKLLSSLCASERVETCMQRKRVLMSTSCTPSPAAVLSSYLLERVDGLCARDESGTEANASSSF